MIDFAQAVWLGAVVAIVIAGATMPLLLLRPRRLALQPVRAHLGDKIGERVRGRRDVYT